jgi:hypothetical protein
MGISAKIGQKKWRDSQDTGSYQLASAKSRHIPEKTG